MLLILKDLVSFLLKILDLFSGIGGFSLGLKRAGMDTVAFCEIDPFCQKVLKKNWPDVPIFADIGSLVYDGPVDVITSGDPCQHDSRANAKRDGISMWKYTLQQVKRHRPLYVLRENVLGGIETGTLAQVESDLKEEGYQVRTYVIPASSIGASHDRSRTWTLAYANGSRCKKFNNATKPGKAQGWKHTMHVNKSGIYWLGSKSPVLRRVDDVPYRVDRIRSLGNALLPEISEIFGNAILHWEFGRRI